MRRSSISRPLRGLRPHAVACLLALAAAFTWLQSVPLPAAVTQVLSPGTYAAYAQWLSPLEMTSQDAETLAASSPMSVAPWLTRGRFGLLAVVAGFALVGSIAIGTRRRVMWMLVALAATGVLHTGLGIAGILIDPTRTIGGQKAGAAFGAFVNQNNACALIIIGMACSVGLLAWRLSALSGFLQNPDRISASTFRELLSDPVALLATVACIVCLAGLLTSGSRGGLAAPVFSLAICLGYFHFAIGRRGRAILVAGIACGLITAFLLVRFGVPLRSVDEINRREEAWAETLASDGRWDHWADAVQTSLAHWTTGAGGGTYRYAYLPHQATSTPSWCFNADNLWLEWIVETGLVGVVILGLLLWGGLASLWKLGRAADPLDFGLGAAAAVAFAGLAFTQFFDFGLLLIPSAAAAAVLFATAAARAAKLHPPPGRVERQRGEGAEEPEKTRPARSSRPSQEEGKGVPSKLHPPPGRVERQRGERAEEPEKTRPARSSRPSQEEGEGVPSKLHPPPGRVERQRGEGARRAPAASRSRPSRRGPLAAVLAVFTLIFVANVAAVRTLHAVTNGEFLVRAAGSVAGQPTPSPAQVGWLLQRLQEHTTAHPMDSQSAVRLCEMQVIAARQRATAAELEIDPALDAAQTYNLLGPRRLRTLWYQNQSQNQNQKTPAAIDVGVPAETETELEKSSPRPAVTPSVRRSPYPAGESPEVPAPLLTADAGTEATEPSNQAATRVQLGAELAAARRSAVLALRWSPLSDEARFQLVRLDFAGGTPAQSREALTQMASLRRQNATSLSMVARLAVEADMWDAARDVWRRMIFLNPSHAGSALAAIRGRGPLRPSDVVPATPAALAVAAGIEVSQAKPDVQLLVTAQRVLSAGLPVGSVDRAARLRLLAKIASKLGKLDEAVEYLEQAVQQQRRDADLRYEYAKALEAAGNPTAARQQLRNAQQLSDVP